MTERPLLEGVTSRHSRMQKDGGRFGRRMRGRQRAFRQTEDQGGDHGGKEHWRSRQTEEPGQS